MGETLTMVADWPGRAPRRRPHCLRATRTSALALSLAATLGVAACGDARPDRETTSSRSATQDGAARSALRDGPPARGVVAAPAKLALGRPASAAWVAALDIDANAAGAGLPRGRGTYAEGAALYAARCAACHGAKGEGLGPYPRLVGPPGDSSFRFGTDPAIVKTIGNYWPYATTLYDYIHRTMPFDAPGSLRPPEVYGLVAYLLAENRVIGRDAVVDARTLPAVRMPARGRFVPDDRRGGPEFR